MFKAPNMLLVGSTGRNTGKTTFCLAFMKKWKTSFNIIGLKVTAVRGKKGVCHHGEEGCGVCTTFIDNFDIIEETDSAGEKDTQKLLEAGAEKVFWVRTLSEYTAEAVESLLAEIPADTVIVCESNALTGLVTPGVSVLMHRECVTAIKPSAEPIIKSADLIVDITEPENINRVMDKIKVTANTSESLVTFKSVYKSFTLVILAGGKSRRMGQDKAGLMYKGRSFLECLVNKGRMSGFSEIIISGSDQKYLGTKNVTDELKGRGPLGGMYSCLREAASHYCFIVTVDTPKLDFDMLAPLAEFHLANDKRATLLVSEGKKEPLISVYNSDLYAEIYEVIKDSPQKIIKLFDVVPYGTYDFEGDSGILDNINTPEDYMSL